LFALTNLPHARDVGGEDLYQWWGVSQWAGRPKQDTRHRGSESVSREM
jgi:hypothetical protein